MHDTLREDPWAAAVEEAWLAFSEGTLGIGAVVVGADGAMVARGRNGIFGSQGLALSDSTLAHAEVNAIAALGPTRPVEHLTLFSTLEPCLLCLAASVLGGIDEIVYLAPDPLWAGTERLPEINEFVASRWPSPRLEERESLTSFSFTLAVHDLIRDRRAQSVAVAAAEAVRPDLVAIAEAAVASGVLDEARRTAADWRDVIEAWPPTG